MTRAAFEILDAASPRDAARWAELWRSWPQREVFAHPRYARLYADERTAALCAASETPEGCVLYPFLLRDLTAEPFWAPALPRASDIATPYGYGGPFFWGSGDAARIAERFWEQFSRWALERNVVCELVRFTLFSETLLPYPGAREEKLENVVRSLTDEDATMWMEFEHKVRKNVNKAERLGVHVEADPDGERIDEFLRVYHGTMDRREAGGGYYFPRAYFERIRAELAGQAAYFHAVHEGRVVSTELVLVSAENVYSFLGGTDAGAFDLRPNDLLKWEIIRWARKEGKLRFVLGGGSEPGDGVFRYKRSFAPKGCVPFSVGYRVLRPDLYEALVASRRTLAEREGSEWLRRPGYFPAYRA